MGSKRTAVDVAERAGRLGPVKTMLRLCHVGHDEDPLGRLQTAIDSVSKKLAKELGEDGFNELLAATGTAFRLVREFRAAAYFFHRSSKADQLLQLGKLAYAFGDVKALRKIDGYARKDKLKPILATEDDKRRFLVEKAIPALPIGGDQYHGFTLDAATVADIKKMAGNWKLGDLLAASVRYLEEQVCTDVAKLYILASHSGDKELAHRVGETFASQAARPRRRTVDIVKEAFPDSSVEVLRKGDTASVRPQHRFILELTHAGGKRCVLKEILPKSYDNPGSLCGPREAEILRELDIPGIPKCHEILNLKGLEFIRICHFEGERLHDILSSNEKMSAADGFSICRQLTEKIAKLHEASVVHFDLRDENILWDGKHASLVGFDRARYMTAEETAWLMPGFAPFVPPEVALNFHAGCQADCFQLGLLFCRLVGGRHPFGRPAVPTPRAGNRELMLVDYAIPTIFLAADIDESIDGELRQVVEGLLEKDPAKRMTAREAFDRVSNI